MSDCNQAFMEKHLNYTKHQKSETKFTNTGKRKITYQKGIYILQYI